MTIEVIWRSIFGEVRTKHYCQEVEDFLNPPFPEPAPPRRRRQDRSAAEVLNPEHKPKRPASNRANPGPRDRSPAG